jgi:hypothetical protein
MLDDSGTRIVLSNDEYAAHIPRGGWEVVTQRELTANAGSVGLAGGRAWRLGKPLLDNWVEL